MKHYYAQEPKPSKHYLARREWTPQTTLPPELQKIKDALLNRTKDTK